MLIICIIIFNIITTIIVISILIMLTLGGRKNIGTNTGEEGTTWRQESGDGDKLSAAGLYKAIGSVLS